MKLTVKEALEQGYSLCGWSGRDWQHLSSIEDLTEDDFKSECKYDGFLVLAEKKSQSYIFDEETLKELIAENVGENYRQECSDDDSEIEDLIKEIDFTDIVKTINKKIESKRWWFLTDIELTP